MMGYRSEVAYIVKVETHCLPFKDDKEVFKIFMAELKAKEETRQAIAELENSKNYGFETFSGGIDYEECEIKFYATGLKWYPDFKDVQAHHAIMDTAKEWNEQYKSNFVNGDGFLFSIGFVRVGEDIGDIEEEHEGQGYEYLGVYQSVHTSWD